MHFIDAFVKGGSQVNRSISTLLVILFLVFARGVEVIETKNNVAPLLNPALFIKQTAEATPTVNADVEISALGDFSASRPSCDPAAARAVRSVAKVEQSIAQRRRPHAALGGR